MYAYWGTNRKSVVVTCIPDLLDAIKFSGLPDIIYPDIGHLLSQEHLTNHPPSFSNPDWLESFTTLIYQSHLSTKCGQPYLYYSQ